MCFSAVKPNGPAAVISGYWWTGMWQKKNQQMRGDGEGGSVCIFSSRGHHLWRGSARLLITGCRSCAPAWKGGEKRRGEAQGQKHIQEERWQFSVCRQTFGSCHLWAQHRDGETLSPSIINAFIVTLLMCNHNVEAAGGRGLRLMGSQLGWGGEVEALTGLAFCVVLVRVT